MYDEWQFALPYNLGGKQSPPPQWQHAPRFLLSRTRNVNFNKKTSSPESQILNQ